MNNFWADKQGKYDIRTVTIQTVDQALFDYFDKKAKPHIDAPDGRKKVQIMFATGERWALIKKENFRDKNGSLILPILSINRTGIDRTLGFGGMAAQVPNITITKQIHGKTPNLQNALETRRLNAFPQVDRGNSVIYEYTTVPFPDFAIATYDITIWTQFQTQMNEILEKIFYKYDYMDSFVCPVEYEGKEPKGNSYYFVAFRDNPMLFSQSNVEEFSNEERIIKYTYSIRIPFYLITEPKEEVLSYGKDEKGKNVVYKQQNAVEIKTSESVLSEKDWKKIFG